MCRNGAACARTRARIPVEEISTLVTGQCRQGTRNPGPPAASPRPFHHGHGREMADPLGLVPALELTPLIHAPSIERVALPGLDGGARPGCPPCTTVRGGASRGRWPRAAGSSATAASSIAQRTAAGVTSAWERCGGRADSTSSTRSSASSSTASRATIRCPTCGWIERSSEDADLRGTHRTPPEGAARADALLPSPRASSESG